MTRTIRTLSFFVVAALLTMSVSACHWLSTSASTDTVDCTSKDLSGLAAVAKNLAAWAESQPGGFSALEQTAETAGVTIGGCILADAVDDFLANLGAKKMATLGDAESDPRFQLDKFRAKMAPGTAFKSAGGVH